MKTYWVCMASQWSVPPISCTAAGEGPTGAEKHTKETHHPTTQTANLDHADRLLRLVSDYATGQH